MCCPTRDAIQTANPGWVGASKRMGRDNESSDCVSSSECQTVTMTLNRYILSAISAADGRMRFWTTKSPWRRFFRFKRSVVKDLEHATKEINHVAGELTVRISSHTPEPKADGLKSYSYSNKFTVARSKTSVDLSLKSPLPSRIVLPERIFPHYPLAAPGPVFPPHQVLDLVPVPPLWVPRSLPTVPCMRVGRHFVDRELGR